MHQLEDLDFADDLALLAHTHSQMQEKTIKREALSSKVGVNINTEKTKIMRIKNKPITRITINNHDIEEVTSVTYLGSVINITGGTDEDVLSRIGKARSAFNILGNISRSREITTGTKMRIFVSNVKSVLFYGCETWTMTEKTVSKLQTSINRCLRRILRIFWPPTISNFNLWEASRRRGRPPNSWRRDTERTIQLKNYTWTQMERLARDRGHWRSFVSGLCSEME